jgi:hypothetical protein
MIFCELKSDSTPVKPAGLEYGPNYFKFPGAIDNVDQLTKWFYEILHKKALLLILEVLILIKMIFQFVHFTTNI